MTDFDTTIPGDSDIVADHPPGAREFRTAVSTWAQTEHHEGPSSEDRHKMGMYADDTARDAVITTPQDGNFAFQLGAAAAAADPRALGLSFYQLSSTTWFKGYFVPTGMIGMFAFDPAAETNEGWLPCDGAEIVKTAQADLFTVIGTTFDLQEGAAAPAGANFRVPNIAGHSIVGITAGKVGQVGWVRNISDLRDLFVTGTAVATAREYFIVEITSAATPDVFRWSNDGGATYTSGVNVASTTLLGATGVTINWGATTGHSVGDIWTFVSDPALASLGSTVGVDAWSLVSAEVPAHDHGGFTGDPPATDEYLGTANPPKAVDQGGSTNAGGSAVRVDLSADFEHHHKISSVGGDEAHDNQPHVLVLGHMIKT